MEIIYLILIALLFVWFRNSIATEIKELKNELRVLHKVLEHKFQNADKVKEKSQAESTQEDVSENKGKITKAEPAATPPMRTVKIEPQKIPVFSAPQKTPAAEKPGASDVKTSSPSFFEKHPDLEKFIGENLINKIGIGILVLGIAFFVKYAIDKQWINEIGRVCIGIGCGGILIGLAHRMRKSFQAFGSVLIGGGLAVLYFTISIAFHEYSLFSQQGAFIIMVVITAFAVMLSIAYDRMELAVLALIGGFSTPFIVSTGSGDYKVLFTYLLILNVGMLFLAYRRKWNLVNLLSYIFTVIIYGSWLTTKCLFEPNAPYAGALLFGTSFYLIFFLMNIVYNIRNKIAFGPQEIGLLLSNTFLYYAAAMAILHFFFSGYYQGLFTVLMAAFNFAFAFLFYKGKNIDRNLIYLLLGLVLTFISLTAPIQLEGNHITLFWSAESVLLLWFAQKSGIRLIKVTSVLVAFLMVISLVMDWYLYINPHSPYMPVIINKLFITSIISIIALIFIQSLLRKEKDQFIIQNVIPVSIYKIIVRIATIVILYFALFKELLYQLYHYDVTLSSRSVIVGTFNMLFLSVAFIVSRKLQPAKARSITFLVFSVLCLLLHLIIYNQSVIAVRNEFLKNDTSTFVFFLHFFLSVLLVYVLYIAIRSAKMVLKGEAWDVMIKFTGTALFIFICSAELNHIVTWMSFSPGRIIPEINKQVSKAGYSVLWGIVSLVLMQQGMKQKDRILRICSLTLFFITIVKLFLWDIVGISESGKIIAFISLGILLLVVSFMYQRLKKLILENEPSLPDEENKPAL